MNKRSPEFDSESPEMAIDELLEPLLNLNMDVKLIENLKNFFLKRQEEYQIELDDFQQSSRELEQELETQLTLAEKRSKDLEARNARLMIENDSLKARLSKLSQESSRQIHDLEKNLAESQATNETLTRCIRELEQSNDDLERAKRALAASLDDFESKLHHQMERNVLLENELGEKEELEVVVQRLKDEARDLRCELMVQQQQPTVSLNWISSDTNSRRVSVLSSPSSTCPSSLSSPTIKNVSSNSSSSGSSNSSSKSNSVSMTTNSPVCSNGNTNNNNNNTLSNHNNIINLTKSRDAVTANSLNGTPVKQSRFFNHSVKQCSVNQQQSLQNQHLQQQQPPASLPLLSPSTRISALNIVSDLLRKVGALESKLASCRNIVPPGTPKSKSSTIASPLTSPN